MKPKIHKPVFYILLILFVFSCEDKERVEKAAVVTGEVEIVSTTRAIIYGTIVDIGQGISQHGHCWSDQPNPEIKDQRTEKGSVSETGEYSSELSNLNNFSVYYYRSYIISEGKTTYGEEYGFDTNGNIYNIDGTVLLKDSRDGKNYKTKKIGDQVWMAENLAYLPQVSPPASGSDTEPYYYVYGYEGTNIVDAKSNSNYETYGVLYNWPAALNACPSGWHLPSDEEWKTLEMHLGMSQNEADDTGWRGTNEGGKLKETGTAHWYNPNTGANNESGFTAVPGGYRYSNGGYFYSIGYVGYWWGATESSTDYAWYRGMENDNGNVGRHYFSKRDGFSVRCLRD